MEIDVCKKCINMKRVLLKICKQIKNKKVENELRL